MLPLFAWPLRPKQGPDGARLRNCRVQVEEDILNVTDDAPFLSTREISRELRMSQWMFFNHFQRVQGLVPADYPLRHRYRK